MDPAAEPDEGTPEPSTGLIDRFGAGRVVAAIAALVVAIAAIASLGGSDEPAPPTTATPLAAATSTTIAEGPQVPPIDTCTLLPTDMVDQALGLVDEDGVFRSDGAVMFEIGETCRWEAEIDDTGDAVTLELGPGEQSDFDPATQLVGVAATGQPDVGDVAVWYGADTSGVMSSATNTDNGILFVRLTIERPEIDDDTRRKIAADLVDTAIQRIRFGPPPPVEVDLCELISDEDAEAVLAPHREGRPGAREEVFGGGSPNVVDLTGYGDSDCQKLILTEIYVTAAMASESDFGPDAAIDGVPGRPIVGIGDEATWFEAVPGSGSFASPHDTDIIAVREGRATFRIITALPDLDRIEQIDATTELALVALTRLPGVETTVVRERPEPIDAAGFGFVDNVLARAQSGEWTVGEGIVATLELLADEATPDTVLESPDLTDSSATELIRMARAYLDDGPDATERREIERLLDSLTIPIAGALTEGQPEARITTPLWSRSPTPPLVAGRPDVRRLAAQTAEDEDELQDDGQPSDDPVPEPPGEDRGYAPPPDFPDDEPDLPLDDEPTDLGCSFSGGNGWTAVPAYESEGGDLFTAQIVYPEVGLTPGWNEGHLTWVRGAVEDTLDVLAAGSPPCLNIVLTTHGGSSSWVIDTIAPGQCAIFLNTPMQTWEEPRFKQSIARDIGHCLIPVAWPEQFSNATYTDRRWWNGALAEFIGNVVYPAPQCQAGRCDLEWRLSPTLKAQEPTIPMMRRQDANWMFFQHLWWLGGFERVRGVVDQLPASGDPLAHENAVATIDGISVTFHDFTETLTDGSVQDSGGGQVPYDPTAEPVTVSGARTIQRNLQAFGMKRIHLRIDSGKTACVQGKVPDNVLVTYRPGPPGLGGVGTPWEELPEETTQLWGEFVFVATTTDPEASFSIDVTDVVDEGEECEEDEETGPEPADIPDMPCLAVCGPSDFYRARDQLFDWFREVVGA